MSDRPAADRATPVTDGPTSSDARGDALGDRRPPDDALGNGSSCLGDASVQSQCNLSCPSGEICWDYAKHDPTCTGTICSIPCCGDADCVAFAGQHGAAAQNNAHCGTDHLCNLVGILGSFGCQ